MSFYVYPVVHHELGIVGVYMSPRDAISHLREFRTDPDNQVLGYMQGEDVPPPGFSPADSLSDGISVNLVQVDEGMIAYTERQMVKDRYVKDVR